MTQGALVLLKETPKNKEKKKMIEYPGDSGSGV